MGMIVQAGIQGFVTWYRDHGDPHRRHDADSAIAAQVFGAAPRALAGVINLQQTVELVRLTIDVVEENIDELRRPPRRARPCTRAAALRPRARLRDRRGLRPRRRDARRLGRPARGPGRRLRAARRRGRDRAVPGQRPGLGRPRPRGRGGGRRPGRPRRDRPLRRGTARRRGSPAWTPSCAAQGDRMVVVLGGVERGRARGRRGPATTSGRGRWCSGRWPPTWPRRTARPRRRSSGLGRPGLAGRAAARRRRRPAPRAGARRGRPTPASSWSTEVYEPLLRRRGHPDRDPRRLLRPAARRSRARRGCSSCTPTPSATACARPASSPGSPPRDAAGRLHRRIALALGGWPAPELPGSRQNCRNPDNETPDYFVRARRALGGPDTAEWYRARHRRSRSRRSDARFPHALAGGRAVRRAPGAGSPRWPASIWRTTAPRRTPTTIRDTAVAQPLLVAAGLLAGLALFPPPPTPSARSARWPGTASVS